MCKETPPLQKTLKVKFFCILKKKLINIKNVRLSSFREHSIILAFKSAILADNAWGARNGIRKLDLYCSDHSMKLSTHLIDNKMLFADHSLLTCFWRVSSNKKGEKNTLLFWNQKKTRSNVGLFLNTGYIRDKGGNVSCVGWHAGIELWSHMAREFP